MAVSAAFEEAIRLVLETSGAEGVEALQRAVSELGDVSAETLADTSKLVDELVELNDAAAKAAEFERLAEELAQTEHKMAGAQEAAYQLALQLAATEKPSKQMVQAQKQARAESDLLEASYSKQWGQLERVELELKKAGVNTADLGSAQSDLRNQIGSTAAAIDRQAQAVRNEAAAVQQLKQRMDDGDDAFRKQSAASRAAAESLQAYRDRAAVAASQTDELTNATRASESVLSRLKGVAAAALGFISFQTLAAGIKSIVQEGSDAEQELGQLEATLVSTGRQAEFTAAQLKQIGSSLQTGLFSEGDITNAQTRLLSYTNIVGEQYPKALQVAIDQAQRLGISTEASAEIVGRALQTPTKAMESLSKQGFVLEDSQKQLLKQLEATGRTAEGQAIILDMLVESYGGSAAAAKVGKAAGLWHAVKENFKDFQQQIADRGVLDYFKLQLTELLTTADRLAKDGTLGRWAQQAADAIIGAATLIKRATQWVAEHRDAIVMLAKAYGAFKIGQAALQLNTWRVALVAATKAQISNAASMHAAGNSAIAFGKTLKRIPTSIHIAVALIGIELAIIGATALGESLAKNSAAVKEAAELSRSYQEQMYRQAIAVREVAVSFAEYKEAAVLTAAQVALLGEKEREAYQARLDGLKRYLGAQSGYLLLQKAMGLATDEQLDQLEQMPARLAAVRAGYAAIESGVRSAAEALRTGVTPAAQLVIEKLEGINRDAKLAVQSVRQLFEGINFADSNALGNVGLALASIAAQSAAADRNVREGLLASLRHLSGEELLRFQVAAQAAFAEIPEGAAATAAVLDQTLASAMEKLGVSAERMGLKFTAAGRDATAAFSAILENANAVSSQVEVAFKAALSKVATLDEAKALGAILESAGQQGKIGFEQAERAAAALNARILQITNAMDPLSDEFGRLGITSQASLVAARDAAKSAFDAIRSGAAQGKSSIEDVRRAMKAYGDAARASVADSDSSAKARVESELSVMEAIYGSREALGQMRAVGSDATRELAAGSEAAAAGLRDVAEAAKDAADASNDMADSAGDAAGRFDQLLQGNTQMSFSLGEVGDGWREAMAAMVANARAGSPVLRQFAAISAELARQRRELAGLVEELDTTAAKYDETAKRRAELREQFNYLSDSALDSLIQKETQIESMRKQRAEERAREADAERQANESRLAAIKEAEKARAAAGEAMNSDEQRLVIDWRAPSKGVAASASAAEIEQAERLAELVAPRVLQRIERARSVSNTRRAGR